MAMEASCCLHTEGKGARSGRRRHMARREQSCGHNFSSAREQCAGSNFSGDPPSLAAWTSSPRWPSPSIKPPPRTVRAPCCRIAPTRARPPLPTPQIDTDAAIDKSSAAAPISLSDPPRALVPPSPASHGHRKPAQTSLGTDPLLQQLLPCSSETTSACSLCPP
jgi:hypothetical protein